jgi:hypothetical protein
MRTSQDDPHARQIVERAKQIKVGDTMSLIAETS